MAGNALTEKGRTQKHDEQRIGEEHQSLQLGRDKFQTLEIKIGRKAIAQNTSQNRTANVAKFWRGLAAFPLRQQCQNPNHQKHRC